MVSVEKTVMKQKSDMRKPAPTVSYLILTSLHLIYKVDFEQ